MAVGCKGDKRLRNEMMLTDGRGPAESAHSIM